MKNCILCLLFLSFFAGVSDVRGDLFTINTSGDRYVRKNRNPSAGVSVPAEDPNGHIVGVAGSNPSFTGAAVLPFELPTIPAGHTVVGANLSFSAFKFNNKVGSPFLDLYGLDVRAADAVLPIDFYESGTHDPNATLIQDSAITPALGVGPSFFSLETDTAADAALVNYLNGQIDDGAVAGDFAFLRFNVDRGQAGDPKLFRIGSTLGGLGAVLTITTAVPEPSAFLFGTLVCIVSGLRYSRCGRGRGRDRDRDRGRGRGCGAQ